MKKISVIIPIYNTEKYLSKCVSSVINQTYKNIEIILIDDGSTDRSLNICKKFSKNDDRIKVIYEENKGVSYARNMGIKNSTGEYITFIDSDDFIDENMLLNLYNVLIKENADVSVCGYDFYDGKHFKYKKRKNYTLTGDDKYKGIFSFNCQGKLYKKELFNNILFDNKTFAEDAYINFKLLKKVNKITYILEKPLYHYRKRNNSLSTTYGVRHFELLDVINEIIDFLKDFDKGLYKKALVYRYINFGEIIYNIKNIDKCIYDKYYNLFTVYKKEILKEKLEPYDKLKVILFTYFPKIYLKYRNY